MKIAIIGWGSLIWDPKNLKTSGEWQNDGPILPIEFARISNDGRLTLVIKNNSKPVQTLWIYSTFNSVEEARENLRIRENCVSTNPIGYMTKGRTEENTKYNFIKDSINEWLTVKNLDAAIWTDLGVKFKDSIDLSYNLKNAKEYVNTIDITKRRRIKEYILNAPVQIQTDNRVYLEDIVKDEKYAI